MREGEDSVGRKKSAEGEGVKGGFGASLHRENLVFSELRGGDGSEGRLGKYCEETFIHSLVGIK